MSESRRTQFLTDEAVQGELLFRAIIYWFFCLLVVSLLVIGWALYTGPPRPLPLVVRESLVRCAPAVFGSVVLLPVVLIDVLKVSSRFVGPIQQIRNATRSMAMGEPARFVTLRKDDFWQDLAEYTNQLVAEQDHPSEERVEEEEVEEDFPCTDRNRSDEISSGQPLVVRA